MCGEVPRANIDGSVKTLDGMDGRREDEPACSQRTPSHRPDPPRSVYPALLKRKSEGERVEKRLEPKRRRAKKKGENGEGRARKGKG